LTNVELSSMVSARSIQGVSMFHASSALTSVRHAR
jgi:hypothetical protein